MKNNISIFDDNTLDYDNWFERHSSLYRSELLALQKAIPVNKEGIEIGIGTGRFAEPFNIKVGIEPSDNMAILAEQRGATVIRAFAENLPIINESFDYVLMVTTICFLKDVEKAFSEAFRILKPKGEIILAFIDKNSAIGKKYEKKKAKSSYYQNAHFHSTVEISNLVDQAGFTDPEYWQTLFNNDEHIEEPKPGFGQGSFVVIKATKP